MAFERLVALQITDESEYAEYRKGMKPILKQYGGYFTSDFKIEKVLPDDLGDAVRLDPALNRLFSIRFPNKEAMESFFADPGYREVRKQHFEKSVAKSVRLALYTLKE